MLVHLPIGILVLASFLIFYADARGKKVSRFLLDVMIGAGALCALAAVFTGLTLSRTGDYDADAVFWHQGAGIATTIVVIGAWLLFRADRLKRKSLKWVTVLWLVLLVVTGHDGASLTHGADYLIGPLAAGKGVNAKLDLASLDIRTTAFYPDVIRPIFEKHCITCHGPGKQKGKLRLDGPDYILKGGKSGKAIDPRNQSEGALRYRVCLPLQHEDHMPPKEKTQLSPAEITWIKLWVAKGADFDKMVGDLFTQAQLDSALGRLTSAPDLPTDEVPAPDEKVIGRLMRHGLSVTPVAQGSHYLMVSFISTPDSAAQWMHDLSALQQHVIALALRDCRVDDAALKQLRSFNHLSRLSLDRTQVTDAGLVQIAAVHTLTSLSLTGNDVSTHGIEKLKELPRLKNLYLYQTKISEADHAKIKAWLPITMVDFGDYVVPALASDTQVVKDKRR